MEKRIDDSVVSAIREVVMVVRHLVDHPDDVKVDISQKGYAVIVGLYTHPGDVGQVVGKNGHIKISIRSLIAAVSGKSNVRTVFEYVTEGDNRTKCENRSQRYG